MPNMIDIQVPSEDSIDVDELLDELENEEALTPEERKELAEEAKAAAKLAEEEAIQLNEALNQLGATLEGKFKDYASKRKQKEVEWVSAILQYEGPDRLVDLKDLINNQLLEETKNKISVNITRPRVSLAISKMRDIQFPLGGDHNFHLATDPLLPLQENMNNNQPVQQEMPMPGMPQPPQQTVGQVARDRLVEEHNKARRMEIKIKEQLSEVNYGRKAREAMWDWAVLGTAILKGPIVKQAPKRTYEHISSEDGTSTSLLSTTFEAIPTVERVDPRLFWPDPSALSIEDAEDAFEGHPVSKKELRDLANNPAFMAERISKVLLEEPDADFSEANQALLALIDTDTTFKNRYLAKEYRGVIPKDILKLMGKVSESEYENPLIEYYGEVWVIRGTVIRLSLSAIEGESDLPYRLVVWDKDPGSMLGHGMCYMMKDQAKVVKSTWQMLLDNSGLSAGPQIVLNKDGIEPANGNWDIEPMKLWYATEYMEDVRRAFQFVDIPNNQAQLSNVIDAALQFADMESSSPMIQANAQPQAHVPAMNMGMVLSEANVHQRELSQSWDDCITEPLISSWIHYNIQYLDDPSIKGNFHVEVGGATERIDNQILAQDIERILSTSASNPDYSLQINEEAAFRRWVSATRAGNGLLRSPEEVERKKQELQQQAEQAPPDPDSIRAQAVMMQEETRQQQQQLDAQFKEREMMLKETQAQTEIQMKHMELQQRNLEMRARLQEETIKAQTAAMTLAAKQDMDFNKIMADLEIADMNNDVRREMKDFEMDKFDRTVALKEEHGTGVST